MNLKNRLGLRWFLCKPFFGVSVFLITGMALASVSSPSGLKSKAAGISGTFIQYQSWMMQLNAAQWQTELDSMKNAGIQTIVIQWLKSDHSRFFPVHAPGNDPTELILKYADTHGMQVHLGLLFDRQWWSEWDDPDFLRRMAKRNEVFAAQVYARYGKHKSFSGWYIPFELSDLDFDSQETSVLNGFLRQMTAGLKKTTRNRVPISLSVFFQKAIPAHWVEVNYSKILSRSGIDILLIQDGVGAHNWSIALKEKLAPYFKAYQNAARKNHIRVWGVLENFSTQPSLLTGAPKLSSRASGKERFPAEISRLRDQLYFHGAQKFEQILTFDFFHYMSPGRGAAQKKLYREYLTEMNLSVPHQVESSAVGNQGDPQNPLPGISEILPQGPSAEHKPLNKS